MTGGLFDFCSSSQIITSNCVPPGMRNAMQTIPQISSSICTRRKAKEFSTAVRMCLVTCSRSVFITLTLFCVFRIGYLNYSNYSVRYTVYQNNKKLNQALCSLFRVELRHHSTGTLVQRWALNQCCG